MSSYGFQTPVWGPPAWFFIHMVSFNYPVNPTPLQKRQYLQFFKSIGHILPCKHCRESYTKFIANGTTRLTLQTMKNRATVSRWLFKLHNAVNKRICKKSDLNYRQVAEFYEKFRAQCSNKKTHGCVIPEKGIKKRTVIKIIPRSCKSKSIQIDSRCK